MSLNYCSLHPKSVVPKRNGHESYRARSGLKGANSPLDSLSPQLEAASPPPPRTGTGRVTDREAGWEAQTELGEGVGRDFQSQTQPPCQAHKEPAHSPAAARSLRAAPVPVPAAWGTCCSAHRPKPPPAAPPTGSPGLLGHASIQAHPAMPRSSRACTRTLLSLPFPGHSVIRFLNLEAALAPTGDPRPHPLAVADRPGSCGQATTWLGRPVPGGSLPSAGRGRHYPTRL